MHDSLMNREVRRGETSLKTVINGKIILKWTLQKQAMTLRTRLVHDSPGWDFENAFLLLTTLDVGLKSFFLHDTRNRVSFQNIFLNNKLREWISFRTPELCWYYTTHDIQRPSLIPLHFKTFRATFNSTYTISPFYRKYNQNKTCFYFNNLCSTKYSDIKEP